MRLDEKFKLVFAILIASRDQSKHWNCNASLTYDAKGVRLDEEKIVDFEPLKGTRELYRRNFFRGFFVLTESFQNSFLSRPYTDF